MKDKKIEKLDWILNRLIKFKGHVSSNDLHTYGLYDEYKDNQDEIDQDFSVLKSEFFNIGASEFVQGQDDELICYVKLTSEFKNKYGSFNNYYIENAKEKEDEEVKKKNNETIEKRKNAMVNHNYFITRPKNIIGIVLIIIAFIGLGTYKDIMEYLKSDKENEETQLQEYNKEEGNKSNELEKKKTQVYSNSKPQSEITELKTDEKKK